MRNAAGRCELASVGAGSQHYKDETIRKYLERIRENLTFHSECLDRLSRLSLRYQKILIHRRNEKDRSFQ